MKDAGGGLFLWTSWVLLNDGLFAGPDFEF